MTRTSPTRPSTPRPARPARAVALAAFATTLALAACGSRGPLEDRGLAAPSEAGVAEGGTLAPEAGSADAAPADGGSPRRDAGRDAGPVETVLVCVGCVTDACGGSIASCVQSAACRDVLQCVASTCLAGGGGPDPACLFGCASSADPAAVLEVVGLFQCVTGTCGATCASAVTTVTDVVGDLLGDGGLGAPPRGDGGPGAP